jgi:hypothetical protein
MKYPKLTEIPTTREMIDVFKGYNHNLRIGSGEFYDMKNLTSDHYPVLSPRPQRSTERSGINAQGMLSKDSFWYVADGKLDKDGSAITDSKMALGVKCET